MGNDEQQIEIENARIRERFRRVYAISPVARYGSMAFAICMAKMTGSLGMPHGITQCFDWGKMLGQKLEEIADRDYDYILTIDGDTVAQTADCVALLDAMDAHPEIDAMSAHQWNRDMKSPLAMIVDENGQHQLSAERMAEGGLVRVQTSHFGLTLLRFDKVKQIKPPYFSNEDYEHAGINRGMRSMDFYFWAKWAKAGFNLFVNLDVPVGHEENFVIWPGANGKPLIQEMGNYFAKGRPAMCTR